MADNNMFVGKWVAVSAVDSEDPAVIQFYKDGSCLVPADLLGKEGMFYFYQVYENGMMKFESGEQGMNLYHCAMIGDKLTLTAMDEAAFSFVKVKEERKSFFKTKVAEVAPAVIKEREPEPEREPEDHEWKCPSCGKINQNYVGTCGCGAPKPNDKLFNWAEVHPDLVPKKEEEVPVIAEEPKEEEKPKKPEIPEREPEEYEWKCPNCGKINQNYVGTCGCGAPKPNDKLFNWAEVHPDLVPKKEEEIPVIAEEPKEEEKPKKPEIPEREPEAYEWKCPNCGKINQNYVGTCGCGASKPNDKLFNWAEVHPDLVPKKEEALPVIEEAPKEEKKAKKAEKPAEPEKLPGENEWKCPNCGKINQNYVGTCGCGERKPANVGPYIPTKEALDRQTPEEGPVRVETPDKK
ncbi:MAG: hypothetical protein IJR57_00555 [Ruminococcus sp.]|nr:hypothetical protein [Ruminococcus sp.]